VAQAAEMWLLEMVVLVVAVAVQVEALLTVALECRVKDMKDLHSQYFFHTTPLAAAVGHLNRVKRLTMQGMGVRALHRQLLEHQFIMLVAEVEVLMRCTQTKANIRLMVALAAAVMVPYTTYLTAHLEPQILAVAVAGVAMEVDSLTLVLAGLAWSLFLRRKQPFQPRVLLP